MSPDSPPTFPPNPLGEPIQHTHHYLGGRARQAGVYVLNLVSRRVDAREVFGEEEDGGDSNGGEGGVVAGESEIFGRTRQDPLPDFRSDFLGEARQIGVSGRLETVSGLHFLAKNMVWGQDCQLPIKLFH